MPYEPLHHKYRPQTFKDLVGQETIAQTLSNALEQKRIAPAYLFTGPRGTGKTSSARILAKSLNCLASDRPTPEPCGKCETCKAIALGSALDVMEIDAASNTGVDNIREIIERSRFAPVQCRYKIYAIDECHMLSTAAFNALLKTLEEPPPQVVFILATTDPQRVLSTIISRCQRFDYRRIPLFEMTNHLEYIARAEKIAIEPEALTLIAQIANGGLRDAESLLDQLSLLPETISVAKVWDLVGAVPEQDLLQLLRLINSNDSIGVLQQCRSLLDRGREPLIVLQNLASFYLNLSIAKAAPQRFELTAVTQTCWQQLCNEAVNWDMSSILRGQQQLKEAETQLKHTTQPRLWLEVTLLGLLPNTREAIALPTATTTNPTITAPIDRVKATTNHHLSPVVSSDTAPKNALTENAIKTPLEREPATESVEKTPQKDLRSTHTEPAISAPARQSTPSTTPSQIVTQSSDGRSPFVANQEIWGKVVKCLQPPTTQALLKQQCHLVSFDGTSAIVGISSAKLQKLNQGKVPNIEAAFAKVCQHRVKVQLAVAEGNATADNSMLTNRSAVSTPPKSNIIATSKEQTIEPSGSQAQSEPRRQLPNQSAQNAFRSTPTASTFNNKSSNSNSDRPLRQKYSPDEPVLSSTATVNQAPEFSDSQGIASVEPSTEEPKNLPSKTEVEAKISPPAQLQQAIDNLTLSFEGELVQLANYSQEHDVSEPLELSPSGHNTDLDRPSAEDYEDEW